MKNLRTLKGVFIIFALLFTPKIIAQTPVPIAQHYVACEGVSINVGFVNDPNIQYSWWYSQSGNDRVISGNRDAINRTKDASPLQILWVQPVINGVTQTRIPVVIELGSNCGTTTPTGCYSTGRILFNEDFGGNSPGDPELRQPHPISGYNDVPVVGYQWLSSLNGRGKFVIRKSSYELGTFTHPTTWWSNIDDHTYPNDATRGYFIAFEAADERGTFYEIQIDSLCIGTELMFSAWIVCLTKSDHSDKANMKFEVLDMNNNVLIAYYTGDIPEDIQSLGQQPLWRNYGFSFNTPTSSVKLRIINNGTGSQGNDFCMDDIQVRLCVPPISLNTNNIRVCDGLTASIYSTYQNDGFFAEPLEYQWYFSTVGNEDSMSGWTAVENDTLNYFSKNITAQDTGYYRVVISGAGNRINRSFHCSAISDAAFIGLLQSDTATIADTICYGESFLFGNRNLTESGIYLDTISVNNNCDSIIKLVLTVAQTFFYDTITVCSNEFPKAYRDTVFQTGTANGNYVFRRHSAVCGCDSIVTLALFVGEPTDSIIHASICAGETYSDNGFNETAAGTYARHGINAAGCDSTIYLILTVNQPTDSTIRASICAGGTYSDNGFNETAAGTYARHGINAAGCDSTIYLILTVNQPADSTIRASICAGGTYSDNGFNETAAGTYQNALTAANGCDSIVTLF
ncbi:MAG: hypothetical protein LBB53_05710, partial [Prevotellaceae bacterium]|nr:hypothetical protein [Prevotellaceae bacterium]